MASNINPQNIDPAFPVAGQDNDSSGFRDNFTNTKNNFTEAKSEIEDLQSKVVLKSALSGTTLDNDGGGAVMKDFEVRDFSETRVSKGSSSGTITFNYTEGGYQTLTTSANITLAFSNWPATGKMGRLRVEITVSNTSHTITLPAAITVGTDSIQGFAEATNVISFDRTGTYIFEFTTHDAGTTIAINDLTRSRNIAEVRTPSNTGQEGDVAGMMVVDGDYVYVCTGTYDGSTLIWKRAALSSF